MPPHILEGIRHEEDILDLFPFEYREAMNEYMRRLSQPNE